MATAEPDTVNKAVVVLGPDGPEVVWWSTRMTYGGSHESYALLTKDGAVLVDPEVVPADVLAQIESVSGRPPVATVLTGAWHERAAYRLRERFGTPVWAPRAGVGELQGAPDFLYGSDSGGAHADRLPLGLQPFRVDDSPGGDTILEWEAPAGVRVLFTGDSIHPLLGRSARSIPAWCRPSGLQVRMHGQRAPEEVRAHYRELLERDFTVICGGHGVPLRDDPKSLLARLLERGRFLQRPQNAYLVP